MWPLCMSVPGTALVGVRTHLHNSFVPADFQHLSTSLGAVGQCEGHNLCIPWKLQKEKFTQHTTMALSTYKHPRTYPHAFYAEPSP